MGWDEGWVGGGRGGGGRSGGWGREGWWDLGALLVNLIENSYQLLSKMTTCARAISEWENRNQTSAAEAREVKLIGWIPPINKMD